MVTIEEVEELRDTLTNACRQAAGLPWLSTRYERVVNARPGDMEPLRQYAEIIEQAFSILINLSDKAHNLYSVDVERLILSVSRPATFATREMPYATNHAAALAAVHSASRLCVSYGSIRHPKWMQAAFGVDLLELEEEDKPEYYERVHEAIRTIPMGELNALRANVEIEAAAALERLRQTGQTTGFQDRILRLLHPDNRPHFKMTAEKLMECLKTESKDTLFKNLNPLKDCGKVKNDRQRGYYLVATPPTERSDSPD